MTPTATDYLNASRYCHRIGAQRTDRMLPDPVWYYLLMWAEKGGVA